MTIACVFGWISAVMLGRLFGSLFQFYGFPFFRGDLVSSAYHSTKHRGFRVLSTSHWQSVSVDNVSADSAFSFFTLLESDREDLPMSPSALLWIHFFQMWKPYRVRGSPRKADQMPNIFSFRFLDCHLSPRTRIRYMFVHFAVCVALISSGCPWGP